jgi:hypothetical protein
MRVMVFVKSTENADSKDVVLDAQTRAAMREMGKFNDDLRAAGILVDCDGLRSSVHGKRIAFDGDTRTVIDGPFPNPRDLVAGFWIWDVKDMDEAVAWAKRCPNPMPEPSEIEIRPYYEMDDAQQT